MLTIVMSFSATRAARLDKADTMLPLSAKDEQTLKNLLPDGEYTYLVIRDLVSTEVIKVEHTCGSLVVTRGQDGTDPRNFPRGSCVRYEIVPAVVKDLICNYNCCDSTCPCKPVAAEGLTLPAATASVAWNGSAIFSGDLPMTIATQGFPSWVKVEVGANFVNFSGTPTGSGSFNVSVAATNCDGQIAIQQGVLQVG